MKYKGRKEDMLKIKGVCVMNNKHKREKTKKNKILRIFEMII